MPKKVICIVGPIAAGKGTLVKILEANGYTPYSFSDRIKEEIKNRGEEISRFSLNKVSNEMKDQYGADLWARKCAELIDQENPDAAVVDGARNPHEIEFLKEKYGAKVIGIVADQETRFARLKARGLVNENLTFKEFKELDDRENTQTGDTAQQVDECLKLADIIIDNSKGTIEDFKNQVTNLDLIKSP